MSKGRIEEIIDLYYSKKVDEDNDYIIALDEEIEVKVMNQSTGEMSLQNLKEVGTTIDLLTPYGDLITKERAEELNPDNIDNKLFWKYAVKKFPYYSISRYGNCKSEEDVNKANLNLAIWNGLIPKLKEKLKSKPNSKVLEIGPGYGNVFNYITDNHQGCNYLAIDINPLFYYDGLFECDGKTIPEELGGNFDFIFSNNVFQHLSKNQRESYYKDIYNKLIDGGEFVFSNFLLAEENKDIDSLWSYKDKNGNVYSTFLSQLTPVDSYEELADTLNDIGFSIKVSLKQNAALIKCIK